MPVPAFRRSRSKARRNRAHQALKEVKLNKCPQCKKAVLPHTACAFCGYYKGKEVIKVKAVKKKVDKAKK